MKILLSIIWSIASVLIIYLAIKGSIKYKFKQLNIKEILKSIKSKSKNDISPLASLCTSLAAKIGVGSLSGIALAIYYGGIGTIFWIVIISLLVSINTYIECILGIKYRTKYNDRYYGGPSYYINKCLNNKYLSIIYSILIITSYSVLFLSIQANTIASVGSYFKLETNYIAISLFIITIIIIIKGIKVITKMNSVLVPIMLLFYSAIGIYILINNYHTLPSLIISSFKENLNLKSIIPIFLIGMQRAIFITESSLGTSAISASTCDNNPEKQAMLEVFGIHLTTFLICLTTFIIIVTSNYNNHLFNNINGIEIVLYAFKYHFGHKGSTLLAIITILFALSTIISSYLFGESNLLSLSNNKIINYIYKTIFLIVIIISCYLKATILWNLTDYFVALLAIINTYSIIKIINNEKV